LLKAMDLHVLGTGAAMVQRHLHASFVVEDGGDRMLVDTMGGYDIVKALRANRVELTGLRALFISHRDSDHALGFPWIARMLWGQSLYGKLPDGYALDVLCSPALRDILIRGTEAFMPDYWAVAKTYLRFHDLAHGAEVLVGGMRLTALDLRSEKTEQFGFLLRGSAALGFCGDEPLRDWHRELLQGVDAVVHDAFCLEADEERMGARQKKHATVLEAARNAASVGAKALILSHIADEAPDRAARFHAEAAQAFDGRIHVPEDGERITISSALP
jgi:ribonuclease Z